MVSLFKFDMFMQLELVHLLVRIGAHCSLSSWIYGIRQSDLLALPPMLLGHVLVEVLRVFLLPMVPSILEDCLCDLGTYSSSYSSTQK
jgi:hypothetical protein